jgi:hypothetical protein
MTASGAAFTALGLAAVGAAAAMLSAVRRRSYLPGGLAEYEPRAADPLRRALRRGMAGVQIPIWPGADGQLYVGWGEPRRADPSGSRTLRRGVLEPLLRRVAATGGQVYAGRDEPFDLLIELPGDEAAPGLALRAYELLDACLRDHATILTRWCTTAGAVPGAVTVTLTGRLSARLLLAERPERLACVDGTLDDLGTRDAPPELAPLLSEHWTWRFGWDGRGPMPPEERHMLHCLVSEAHAEGRRVRFFGLCERPRRVRVALWAELSAAGVDLIGARRLGPLARHLRRLRVPGGRSARRRAAAAEPVAAVTPADGGDQVLLRAAAPTR